MIKSLKAPKNFDLRTYAIGKLAHEVNQKFCEYFKVPKVSYYFESCRTHRVVLANGSTAPTRRNPDNKEVCACERHRLIWSGTGILRYIRLSQAYVRRYNDAPVLFVTPFRTKGKIEELRAEYDRAYKLEDDAYWMCARYAGGDTYDPKVYRALYDIKQKRYFETEVVMQELNRVEYWIGDVSSDGHMMCGDDMWCILWHEVAK